MNLDSWNWENVWKCLSQAIFDLSQCMASTLVRLCFRTFAQGQHCQESSVLLVASICPFLSTKRFSCFVRMEVQVFMSRCVLETKNIFMGSNPLGWVRIKNMRLDLQDATLPTLQPSRYSSSLRRRHTGHLGRGSDICCAQTWRETTTIMAEQPNQVTISTDFFACHEIYSAGPTSQLARCPQGTKAKRAGSSRHTSADRKWTLVVTRNRMKLHLEGFSIQPFGTKHCKSL